MRGASENGFESFGISLIMFYKSLPISLEEEHTLHNAVTVNSNCLMTWPFLIKKKNAITNVDAYLH